MTITTRSVDRLSSGPPRRAAQSFDVALGPTRCETVLCLEVGPELWRGAKCSGEEPRGLDADAASTAHDLTDALERDAEVAREIHLRDAERIEELLAKDDARVGWGAVPGAHV